MTILDVVGSTSMQVGLLAGGFPGGRQRRSRRLGRRSPTCCTYTIGAVTVAAALTLLRRSSATAPARAVTPGRYDARVPTLDRLDAADLRRAVTTFRDTLVAHAAAINALNVYPVPDGDTGTNMGAHPRRGGRRDRRPGRRAGDGRARARRSATVSLMGARGNSGVILSQILRGLRRPGEGRGSGGRSAARGGVHRRCRRAAYGAGAHADRRHDPDRRARGRRGRAVRAPMAAPTSVRCC